MLRLRPNFARRIAIGTDGLSLTKFAEQAGIPRRTLSAWDIGAFKPEDKSIGRLVAAYAKVAHVSKLEALDYLFEEIAEEHPRSQAQRARRQREATTAN